MYRWIVILLAAVAVLSGGDRSGTCPSPAAAAPQQPGGELTVCRPMAADAATEYVSNPAHIHLGAMRPVALRRCPVSAPFGSRRLHCGGWPAAAGFCCRGIARFGVPIPCAVLHPVDYYVYRLRRLLI